MFCTICGKEIPDNSQFCPDCGSPVQTGEVKQPPEASGMPPYIPEEKSWGDQLGPQAAWAPKDWEAPEPPKKKKRSKALRIFLLVLVLTVVLGIAGGVLWGLWYYSPQSRLDRAMDAGEYEAAVAIFHEDMNSECTPELLQDLTQRLNEVRRAYETGEIDYAAADGLLKALEQMAPQQLAELLTQTRAYVETLNASRLAFQEAEAQFAAGDYPAAMETYLLVSELDSNYETAKNRREEAIDCYRQQTLDAAEAFAAEEDFAGAMDVLDEGLGVLTDDADLLAQRERYADAALQQKKEQFLTSAAEAAGEGRFADAIAILKDGMTVIPDDADMQAALDTCMKDCAAQLLAQAAEKAGEKDYAGAMSVLEQGMPLVADSGALTAQLQQKYDSYEALSIQETRRYHLDSAAQYADQGIYTGAITTLDSGLLLLPGDTELTNARKRYVNLYADQVLKEVNAMMDALNYEGAIDLMEAALALVADSDRLNQTMEALYAAEPVSIAEKTPLHSSSKWPQWHTGEEKLEIGGQELEISNAWIFEDAFYLYEYSVEFDVSGGYERLSALAGPWETIQKGQTCFFLVYVDDELKFTSEDITAETEPFSFQVELGRGKTVKLCFRLSTNCDHASAVLANVTLWPER